MRELISHSIIVGSMLCACVVPSAASPSAGPGNAPDPAAAPSEPSPTPSEAPPPTPSEAPPPTWEPPPPSPATTRAAAPSSDAQAFVDAHNRVRAQHCARPLAWSDKLAQIAQRWANALRDKGCAFGHSGGSTGENLAAGTTGTLDPEGVVKMWYDEVAQYRFPSGGFSMQTGHFTQVVWRGTTHVGCGRSRCKGMDIFVCEYDPPGNWEGQYRENVLPKSCRKDAAD